MAKIEQTFKNKLKTFQKASNSQTRIHINASGPRYFKNIDRKSPTVGIREIQDVLARLEYSQSYRKQLIKLVTFETKNLSYLRSANFGVSLGSVPKISKQLFTLVNRIAKGSPTSNKLTCGKLRRYCIKLDNQISRRLRVLRSRRSKSKANSRRANSLDSSLRLVSEVYDLYRPVIQEVGSPSFRLLTSNVLLITSPWGRGKTHSVCDFAVKRQQNKNLTVLRLASRLTIRSNKDIIQSLAESCSVSRQSLFKYLTKTASKTAGRSIVIIDGINETNRILWKRFLPSLIREFRKYPWVGLVLTCRSPFEANLFSINLKSKLINAIHPGFAEIEAEAQSLFFAYYKLPTPRLPLLTPEYSNPLFLRLFCRGLTDLVRKNKFKVSEQIFSGKKGLTYILERFVIEVGRTIENRHNLPRRSCWILMKKIADHIAHNVATSKSEVLGFQEAMSIVRNKTNGNDEEAGSILASMVSEGLLLEDIDHLGSPGGTVFRFSLQRLGDHLIARSVFSNEIGNAKGSKQLLAAFQKSSVINHIFQVDSSSGLFKEPGLAAALILDFPERTRNFGRKESKELFGYLSTKQRGLRALLEAYSEGLLWRPSGLILEETQNLVARMLKYKWQGDKSALIETCLLIALRGPKYLGSSWLLMFIGSLNVAERDLLWAEHIRKTRHSGVIIRLLAWCEANKSNAINEYLICLLSVLSLLLSSTVKTIRDRATLCIRDIGSKNFGIFFDLVQYALKHLDPYIGERLIAAWYGALISRTKHFNKKGQITLWKFTKRIILTSSKAQNGLFLSHALCQNYILGTAKYLDSISIQTSSLNTLVRTKSSETKNIFPRLSKISSHILKKVGHSSLMDFDNYIIGSLVPDRKNYDHENPEYKKLRAQIYWMMARLGYREKSYKMVDREIATEGYYEREEGEKIDRYEKKYGWISFYQMLGELVRQGAPLRDWWDRDQAARIYADFDPTFAVGKTGSVLLPKLFRRATRNGLNWMAKGSKPNYHELLKRRASSRKATWILLDGYIQQASKYDQRRIFTFINGYLVNKKDVRKLQRQFWQNEYPGNEALPLPLEEIDTFPGEYPWHDKTGHVLRSSAGVFRKDLRAAYSGRKNVKAMVPVKTGWSRLAAALDKRSNGNSDQTSRRPKSSDSEDSAKIVEAIIEANMSLPKKHQVTLFDLHEIPTKSEIASGIQLKQISIDVPGILVEILTVHSRLEGRSDSASKAGTTIWPSPIVSARLGLTRGDLSGSLYDSQGKEAYRSFYLEEDSKNIYRLGYLRQDLLRKYLHRSQKMLVWFLWGERNDYGLMDDPADSYKKLKGHSRVHKTTYRLSK